MHNKKNVVVMFLLIMLSFAIISEVSAVSDAEADGTGSDLSINSVDRTNHDNAGERFDDRGMQNHDNDYVDDFKSHNGQNSFNQSSNDFGDKNRNENLYEHDRDVKPDDDHGFNESEGVMPEGDRPSDNFTDMFRPDGNKTGFDMFKPDMNGTDFRPMDNFTGDKNGFEMFKHDNKSMDLRNNESFNVPDREGELMDDVVSKLIGMNNISPNFKKEDEKFPLNNNSKPMRDNESAPQVFGDKKSSDMWKDNINKSNKDPKVVKKSSKKVKTDKKSSKKVKSLKKSKKAGKNLPKKFKRERAKL